MGMIDKPWGYEEQIMATQMELSGETGMLGMRTLVINADEMTSYSYHEDQKDIIYLQEGNVVLRTEDGMKNLEEGEAKVINAGRKHQLQNIDNRVAKVLEISFPYKPDDINRVEDPYIEARD